MYKPIILGEVFDEYVDNQINIRQRRLSKRQKTNDDLVVWNANTPFIRLSSAIFIEKERADLVATRLGINVEDVQGNNLAKRLILWGGSSTGKVVKEAFQPGKMRGGVGYELNNNYGFLTDPSQGYKPMPGIENISVTYKNNGSLKQAQVKLKCFSRKQFEALETIYLRLGYTLLLEWGNSIYFDKENKKQTMSSLDILNILFKNDASIPVQELQNSIQRIKEKTSGNYDGMVAKVANYSWTLGDDLTYGITLDLISVGDIVDSLKMNLGGSAFERNAIRVTVDKGIQNVTNIKLASSQDRLHKFFYELLSDLEPRLLKEAEPATQTLISKSNTTVEYADYIPGIRKAYLDVIALYRSNFVTPYKELRQKLIELGPQTLIYTEHPYYKNNINPNFPIQVRQGETGLIPLNQVLELESSLDLADRVTQDLIFYEDTLGLTLEPVKIEKTPGNLGIGLFKFEPTPKEVPFQLLESKLDSLENYFKTLKPISTRIPRDTNELQNTGDNIDVLEYLRIQTKLSSRKQVIFRALNNGAFDIDERYQTPDIKIRLNKESRERLLDFAKKN